jgi:cytochrome b561
LETTFHPIPQSIHGVIYILLSISLFLTAWIFSNYRNQTFKIFKAALNEQQKNNLIREDSESIKKVTRLLNITLFLL